jgi:hypothetical protein
VAHAAVIARARHASGSQSRFFAIGVPSPLPVLLLLLAGCNSLRLAPSEQQKQNAWLHQRTAAVAAETARVEQGSPQLQALTQLCELQSRAFTAYCGLPQEYPPAETTAQILGESNWQLAGTAVTESAQRPNAWQVADAALEFGIGICALLGGVCGTRAVRFLRDARAKSQALQEIVAGNERFKQKQPAQVKAFKAAQQNQSPETRQLVAALKR